MQSAIDTPLSIRDASARLGPGRAAGACVDVRAAAGSGPDGYDFKPLTEAASPAVAPDAAGALQLLWIERAIADAPSRLWYSLGKAR
jgi:hypothetical protein